MSAVHTLQAVLIAVLAAGAAAAQLARPVMPMPLRLLGAVGWLLLATAATINLLPGVAGHTRTVLFAALTFIATAEAAVGLLRAWWSR